MKKFSDAILFMPEGVRHKFSIQAIAYGMWSMVNVNTGLTIYIFKSGEGYWSGSLSYAVGNRVQNNNLICQAIFEVKKHYLL